MADLRFRFIEDYAGGLLNISRQEISTTGEVLSQDGLTTEGTIFVEDGSGVKTGLKLGVSLAESVDPTTEMGLVNVRFADRTYAKVRDLRIFTTAIASAQSALSEATSTSISNLETAFQLLEDDINTLEENLQSNISNEREKIQELTINQNDLTSRINTHDVDIQTLASRVLALETVTPESQTEAIDVLEIEQNSLYYSGTISISGGIVTGSGTDFTGELNLGDIFIAEDANGFDVEFQITAFDTATPDTKLAVIPTNKTVNAGSSYKRDINRLIAKKINEVIFALKKLNVFV
jgi:hypothetical protein